MNFNERVFFACSNIQYSWSSQKMYRNFTYWKIGNQLVISKIFYRLQLTLLYQFIYYYKNLFCPCNIFIFWFLKRYLFIRWSGIQADASCNRTKKLEKSRVYGVKMFIWSVFLFYSAISITWKLFLSAPITK